MKFNLFLALYFSIASWASISVAPDATAAPAKDDVIPLIQMENVLLPDAIRQLARQARINIVVDPRVAQPPLSLTKVSVRWQGVTAREALLAILENYGLKLVPF